MNEKSHNLYLRVVKLACRNVKSAFCQENGIIEDADRVHVGIRDREGLIEIVSFIFKNPESARAVFHTRVKNRVTVMSDFPNIHDIDAADTFISSVLESRRSRISQKRLIMYLMTERYLASAYDYDKSHSNTENECLSYAKAMITDKYSLNLIGGFLFENRPLIEPSVLMGLKAAAFDSAYALSSEEYTMKLVERRYVKEFESRGDIFVTDTPVAFDMTPGKDAIGKSMIDVFVKKHKLSENEIITQLYESSFANMPAHKRRRRFVNLKSKNRDVEICPIGALKIKRQFAQIEATTKHSYITDYFNKNRPLSADMDSYMFEQEAWMYHYLWQTDGVIYHQNDQIYFPDDTVIEIPDSMKPWEFFHRINTVYAALFGFTQEDARGGSNWLIDSIRKAYTDEGNALYCLMLIDNRIKEIKSERRGD